MKIQFYHLIAVLVLTGLVFGCNTSRAVKGAAIGGSAGAIVGHVIGKKAGNGTAGLIIGSAIGGTAGAVIGDYMDRQARELEQIPGAEVERVGEGILVTMNGGVTFGFDSDNLTASSKQELDRLANVMSEYDRTDIMVDGYTDATGSADYNQQLSERRAQSVVDYLTRQGVSSIRIRTYGYGESNPIASNESEAGRAQNRRVEIGIVANQDLRTDAEDGSLSRK